MMQETDAPPSKQSAVDHVLAQIRDLIREQALAVGDVLPPESELAALFGAGRNTVREAVRTLKADGVVESRQKIGAILVDRRADAVADLFSLTLEISVDNFRDIQEFRRLTEMKLGEDLVGRLPRKTLAELEGINERMALRTDPVQASEYDFQFHYLMVAATGNRTLVEIYTRPRIHSRYGRLKARDFIRAKNRKFDEERAFVLKTSLICSNNAAR